MKEYNNEKLEQTFKTLEEGVRKMFTSEEYKNYLNTMSKFRSYSPNNCILIAMQRPDATYVAGFNDWRKKFKRYVKAEEKGIKIFAYAPRKVAAIEKKENEDGEIELTEVKKEIPSYKIAYVYDVAQTGGEPLPEICHTLKGKVENFPEIKKAISECANCPIEEAEIQGKANGYYSLSEKKIVIKAGMEQTQTVKTMLHELAHALLHSDAKQTKNMTRETKEVQAESIAYIVSKWLGLDTSSYTFGYVSSWSSQKDTKELLESASIIRETSEKIIGQLSEKLNMEIDMKPVQKNKFLLVM